MIFSESNWLMLASNVSSGVTFSGVASWGFINLIAVLLIYMLIANAIKKSIGFLKNSLIPTSVLGGILLLITSVIYEAIAGVPFFETAFFNGNGQTSLEILTYHALALGFIASALKPSRRKFNKQRNVEIFDSGVTTVATYLLQAVLGLGITVIVAYFIMPDFFAAAGIILPFGYGQGTGQALNWGNVFETATDYPNFVGGRSFGLTIAALGFLSASIGGVIHLNIMKKKGKFTKVDTELSDKMSLNDIQLAEEIPVNGSIDKLTVQFGLIFLTYVLTFLLMFGVSKLIPNMAETVFGFNFLFGVILASLVKATLSFLRKKKIVKRIYVNDFMMNRISGFFFDLMVIAGIGAIKINVIKDYWVIIAVLGIVGAVSTFIYCRFIAKKLFPEYSEEQFLATYGMLTGTASTGIILLREIDKDFITPASDNMVYQQIPAIVLGFPIMILPTMAPTQPLMVIAIAGGLFVLMNLILFRRFIFKKRVKKN